MESFNVRRHPPFETLTLPFPGAWLEGSANAQSMPKTPPDDLGSGEHVIGRSDLVNHRQKSFCAFSIVSVYARWVRALFFFYGKATQVTSWAS